MHIQYIHTYSLLSHNSGPLNKMTFLKTDTPLQPAGMRGTQLGASSKAVQIYTSVTGLVRDRQAQWTQRGTWWKIPLCPNNRELFLVTMYIVALQQQITNKRSFSGFYTAIIQISIIIKISHMTYNRGIGCLKYIAVYQHCLNWVVCSHIL